MPKSRNSQVSIEATPYYHCVSRCVRRAFLCGIDSFSGASYEHRRGWVEKRLLKLGQIFCIDVCAYAVMSNQYHVVLHLNTKAAESLSVKGVLERWQTLLLPMLIGSAVTKSVDDIDIIVDSVGMISDLNKGIEALTEKQHEE